uniref:Putative effector protein n=1 Tax=Heterodera avenae TaxID=34510 RepID=A0A2L0VDN5_HETAV|nr:putative effector protein [Heterodera avenae]
MSSSPSSSSLLLFSIIATVCIFFKCCNSAPHPCCNGSRRIVSLMSQHIDTLSNSQSKSSFCSNAQSVAGALKDQLSADKCSEGGKTLVAQIEQNLSTTSSAPNECSISAGFVRAMFAIAASASSHAGNNSEQFDQQVTAIDQKCAEFNIDIGTVLIDRPKGVHVQQNVLGTDSVISSPGKMGPHKQ